MGSGGSTKMLSVLGNPMNKSYGPKQFPLLLGGNHSTQHASETPNRLKTIHHQTNWKIQKFCQSFPQVIFISFALGHVHCRPRLFVTNITGKKFSLNVVDSSPAVTTHIITILTIYLSGDNLYLQQLSLGDDPFLGEALAYFQGQTISVPEGIFSPFPLFNSLGQVTLEVMSQWDQMMISPSPGATEDIF